MDRREKTQKNRYNQISPYPKNIPKKSIPKSNSKEENSKIKEKSLIIFDVDRTITDKDSLEVTSKYLLTKQQQQNFEKETENDKNWCESLNYFYSLVKKNGKTINDIKKSLEKVQMTKNFNKLFLYLKNHKDEYDIIIISGGNKFTICYMMEIYKINDIFKDIYSNIYKINNDQLIIIPSSKHRCDLCDDSLCKKVELDKYLRKSKIKYNKKIFICDGFTDLCLVRNFQSKDVVILRKNFELFNAIYKNEIDFKTKCVLEPWRDGDDIIKIMEKIKNL